MSLIFADQSALVAAVSKLARAHAEYNAAVIKCSAIMLPLNNALEDAKDEFEKAVVKAAKDEGDALADSVDLNSMYDLAEKRQREEAAANEAIAAAAVGGGLLTSTVISDLPN